MLKSLNTSFITKAIYGLVNVLVILLIMEDHPPGALQGAATLFGATLAIAFVEMYAELVGETIGHQRALSRVEQLHIWDTVRPVLIGAQLPTIILLLSALGFYSVDTAIDIDQAVVFVLLAAYGVRAILFQHQTPLKRIVGGILLLLIGLMAVAFKVAFH